MLLEVRDLAAYFFLDEGVLKAVDGLSFDVDAGETVALVGESGCGKTIVALAHPADHTLAIREKKLAEELGVAERVHVLGPRKDVPALMHAIDVFAMPSIWEGFGLVLLEAMAAGRPIVASRVATIPEVVLDGQTGLLVPAGDPLLLAEALAQLADQPALAARLGEAGRERVRRQFSLEKMVGDTELLYRELVDERASGSRER